MNLLLRAAKQWMERFQTLNRSRRKLPALAYRSITIIRMQADDLKGMCMNVLYVHTCTVHIKQAEELQVMAKVLLGFHFGSQPASHYSPFLSGR